MILLCFSFSCSGFDLALIKRSHTLNCYQFLQKLLLKTKLTNSFLVIVVAQFTAKTINSEEAFYFLSFKSCSINKLKSQMLLKCKNFAFQLCLEKKLLQEMVEGWRPLLFFLYSPEYFLRQKSVRLIPGNFHSLKSFVGQHI